VKELVGFDLHSVRFNRGILRLRYRTFGLLEGEEILDLIKVIEIDSFSEHK
jgi:hypothetical protein